MWKFIKFIITTLLITFLLLIFVQMVYKAGLDKGHLDMCFEIGQTTNYDPLALKTCKKIEEAY